MKRINELFNNLKKENKKAFSVFLMSGFPNDEIFVDLMHLCAKSNVDFIEVGMPFSDPQADGPIIKEAGTCALNNGASVQKTINSIKEFRKTNTKTPIVWMGYYNSIYNFGVEKFLSELQQAQVDGLLVVDLPCCEFHRLEKIKQTNIDLIRLATPTTTKERLVQILENAGGFIYYVSINGITGTKQAQAQIIKEQVEYIKTQTNLPVVVGFGIKTPQNVKEINSFADGSIVGSAIVKKIQEYVIDNKITDKNKMLNELENFIRSFTMV